MFLVKKSVYDALCKALGKDNELESLKAEVIAILKKQAKKEHNEVKKALQYLDEHYTYLAKSFDGEIIEKAGYPVGTIREWKGKKYIKIAPKMWKRKFDHESRGAKASATKIIHAVEKCQSIEELMNIVMANKSRFSDMNGIPLPIVDKIRAVADRKNDDLTEKQDIERQAFPKGFEKTETGKKILQTIEEKYKKGETTNFSIVLNRDDEEKKKRINTDDYGEKFARELAENIILKYSKDRKLKNKIKKQRESKSNIDAENKKKAPETPKKPKAKNTPKAEEKKEKRPSAVRPNNGKSETENIEEEIDNFVDAQSESNLAGYLGDAEYWHEEEVNGFRKYLSQNIKLNSLEGGSVDAWDNMNEQAKQLGKKYHEMYRRQFEATHPKAKKTPKKVEEDKPLSKKELEKVTSKLLGKDLYKNNTMEELQKLYDKELERMENPKTKKDAMAKMSAITEEVNKRQENAQKLENTPKTEEKKEEKQPAKIERGQIYSISDKQYKVKSNKNGKISLESVEENEYGTKTSLDGDVSKFQEAISNGKAKFVSDAPVKTEKTTKSPKSVKETLKSQKDFNDSVKSWLDKEYKGFTSEELQDDVDDIVDEYMEKNPNVSEPDLRDAITSEANKKLYEETVHWANTEKEDYDKAAEILSKSNLSSIDEMIDENENELSDNFGYDVPVHDTIKTLLCGKVLNKDTMRNLAGLDIDDSKDIINKISRSFISLMQNKDEKGYSINGEFNKAVDAVVDSFSNRLKGKSFDEICDAEGLNDIEKKFAISLKEMNESDFASMMKSLDIGLRDSANGVQDLFMGGCESKDDVISRVLKIKKAVEKALKSVLGMFAA